MHAFQEYSSSQQPCPRCGRRLPMIGMADHLSECNADPKERKARAATQGAAKATVPTEEKTLRKGQMTQISIGPPTPGMASPMNRPITAGNVEGDYEAGGNGGNFGSNQEFNQQMMQYEMGASGPDNRIECPRCHRKFDPSRIDQHERIC